METFLFLAIGLVLSFAVAFNSLAKLIKQLKSSSAKKLLTDGKTIQVSFNISLSDKKSEVGARHTNSITNRLDKDSS